MKQKLLKTMLLLCALVVGLGNVWADDYNNVATFESATVVTNSTYQSYNNDDWSITCGGNNVSMGSNKNNSTTKCKIASSYGTSASTSNIATAVISKNALSNVSRITFVHTAGSGNSGSIYFAYSTDNSTWNAIDLTTGTQGASTPAANTTMTVTFDEISSAYYAVILDKGNNTAANFRFDNVTITFDELGLNDNDLTITSSNPVNLTITNETPTPTSTVTWTTSSAGALTWDTEDSSIATVSGGVISAVGAGTTNITVSQAAAGDYAASDIKTIVVNVTDASKETPTFELDVTTLNLKVNEEGEINLTTNSDGAISFTCADPAVTIDADDDYAIVSANAAGTYTVNVSTASTSTYNAAAGSVTLNVTKRTATVTIDDALLVNKDVYLQDKDDLGVLDATVKDGSTPIGGATVTWSSTDESVATIASDGTVTLKAVGTTTIRASYAGNTIYAEAYAEYELNVTDSDPAIKISFNNAFYGTSFTGTNAAGDGPFNGTRSGVKVTVVQGSSSNLYVNDSETRIYNGDPDNGSITIEAPTGYVITEIVFTTGSKWSVTATPDGLSDKTWTGSASSVVFSASARSDFQSAAITLSPGVVVSAAGFTTYVTPEAVEFTGVTAYTVTTVGGSSVSLKEVESAPANTPVVIEADEDAYEFTPTDSPASVGTNLLEASDGTVEGDGSTIYALGNKSGVGFYLVGDGVKVPAGKAYLEYTSGAVKEFLSFEFGEDPDGINSLTPALSEGEGAIYNLAGQRISKMQKGINIVNGIKILF